MVIRTLSWKRTHIVQMTMEIIQHVKMLLMHVGWTPTARQFLIGIAITMGRLGFAASHLLLNIRLQDHAFTRKVIFFKYNV